MNPRLVCDSRYMRHMARFLLRVISAVVLGVLLTASVTAALAQTQPDSDDDTATQETPANEQAEQSSEQPPMPDIDSQPIERPAGQGPGRFIPSEQISQDLGVSFPVDI